MDDSNKSIKCEVESCKYNNKANSYCTLNEIKVSSTCDNCNARKKETICDSFEELTKAIFYHIYPCFHILKHQYIFLINRNLFYSLWSI